MLKVHNLLKPTQSRLYPDPVPSMSAAYDETNTVDLR